MLRSSPMLGFTEMTRFSLWTRFAAAALILFVALIVGSNVFSPHVQTNRERAQSIDATIKCPSCQDLSVAQASSPSSIAVRAQVLRDVTKGMSNIEVLAQLESQYGNAILLTPPPGGLSAILWIVPVLIVVLSAAILISVVTKRRRSARPRGQALVDHE